MHRGIWTRWVLAAVVTLAATACGKQEPKSPGQGQGGERAALPSGPAEYTVVLKSTWTPKTHPFEYPKGAHFSGLIGASHNASYSIFALGRRPTPGLERLSEEGKHSPLDDEINAAIAAGRAGMLFETGGLKNFRDSLVTTVRVDPAHPLVSLVAMVAPSPDWFTGAADVNLIENGAWAKSRTLRLIAYDAGGDDGRTYKAADRDAKPKKPTSRAMTRHFVTKGVVVPVATLRLTRR
jgi:hypothetical protein